MTGLVALTVSGPEGFTLAREYPLSVRPATQILARRTVKPLEPGQSITLSGDVFADLVPGHRQGLALGDADRRARRGDACSPRSTAIRSAAPSRS